MKELIYRNKKHLELILSRILWVSITNYLRINGDPSLLDQKIRQFREVISNSNNIRIILFLNVYHTVCIPFYEQLKISLK